MFIPNVFCFEDHLGIGVLTLTAVTDEVNIFLFYKNDRGNMTTNDKKSNKYFSGISSCIDF